MAGREQAQVLLACLTLVGWRQRLLSPNPAASCMMKLMLGWWLLGRLVVYESELLLDMYISTMAALTEIVIVKVPSRPKRSLHPLVEAEASKVYQRRQSAAVLVR